MNETIMSSEPEAIKSLGGQYLKCAVITPIGPGHELLAQEAQASVEAALKTSAGPFTEVVFLRMPDLEGKHGRSKCRNDGIDYALAHGIDWVFFLDADDLLALDAFSSVAPYIKNYDGIFGRIAEAKFGSDQITLRPNQLGPTTSVADIVRHDPFLTLQMGHFVRTLAAAAIRFDVAMNTGEDFKYYLQLWSKFRCAKINRFLFINRRGAHSTGPRSSDGRGWREAVTQVIREFCAQNNVDANPQKESKTDLPTLENLAQFWSSEGLRHIIPNVGDQFPEGFDVRDILKQLIGAKNGVIEIGCGYGRLCGAFPPSDYLGVDVNPSAVAAARETNPGYRFEPVTPDMELPKAGTAFMYTVALHVSDNELDRFLKPVCAAAPIVVIAEIMDQRWRRPGNPPVFNRDPEQYIAAMARLGFNLRRWTKIPYAHYMNNPSNTADCRVTFHVYGRSA